MSPAHGPLISHRYAQPEPGGQLPIPGNITTHVQLMSPAGHNKLNAWERAWLLAILMVTCMASISAISFKGRKFKS